jgi:hypothetical protein
MSAVVEPSFSGVSGGSRASAVAVGVRVDSVLSSVPVVGAAIAAVGTLPELVVVAHGTVPIEQRKPLAELLEGLAPLSKAVVPDQVWASTVTVGAVVEFAGPRQLMVASLGRSKDHSAPAEVSGVGVTVWYGLDKALGPLRVARVGVAYRDRSVFVVLDGSLSLGGFTLEAQGLGVGVGVIDHRVRGTLDGLGLSFQQGQLKILGALLRVNPPPKDLDLYVVGAVMVSTSRLSIAAVGAYGHRSDGGMSLFAFGQIDGLRAQAGPLEIKGLCGGFGYNFTVRVPPVDQVVQFPLVKGLDNPSIFQGGPAAVMAALTAAITPSEGEFWLAVGAHAALFEFIDLRALLILQVGNEFSLTVLGLASAAFPASGRAWAKATLQVRASYHASVGELQVLGVLTPDSYLIDPSCRLTGGFAVCVWLAPSRQAGDFVFTAGGYHPDFQRRLPDHYPRVERIGFRWSISSDLSAQGECYAALTPSAFMLGAALNVTLDTEVIGASLNATVDALVQWKPFFFDVSVTINFSAWLKDLGWSVSAGVGVRVWGPPTGGVITMQAPVVGSLSFPFGPPRPDEPAWLKWKEFHSGPLAGAGVELTALTGVRAPSADQESSHDQQGPWSVSPGGFSFLTRAPTPITTVCLTHPHQSPNQPVPVRAKPFWVRPMNTDEVTATHTVTVTPGKGTVVSDDQRDWPVDITYQLMPPGLWGHPVSRGTTGAPSVEQALCQPVGIVVTVPSPRPGHGLDPIEETRLEVKTIEITPPPTFCLNPTPEGPRPGAHPGTRRVVADTLIATAPRRGELWQAMTAWGVAPPTMPGPKELTGAPPGELTDLADRVYSYLDADPMTEKSQGVGVS